MTDRFRSEGVVIAYLAFLGVLMATGIDMALPAFDEIDADLGASGSESLIVTLYLMGTAFGQLLAGPMSDVVGRQRVLGVGLALYVIGAIACALAPNFVILLIARFVWGLGAAGPTGMRTAIARDLYSGDAMARVTTIMMAVFLLGPIFTPLIGEGILTFASWRIVFLFAVILGVVAAIIAIGFGETLPPESRRELSVSEFGDALRKIGSTRVTMGHMGAVVFWSAAFFIFLGSAQPIFDDVFDRSDQFAFLFAVAGGATIPLLLLNNALIARWGARRASLMDAVVAVAASSAGVVYLVVVDDTPGFWLWYGWLIIAASFITLATPPMYALALEPMGELAGTASALMFFSSFAFGSGLAAIFSALVDDTVVPFVVGFAVYGALAFACQLGSSPDRAAAAS